MTEQPRWSYTSVADSAFNDWAAYLHYKPKLEAKLLDQLMGMLRRVIAAGSVT